MGRGHHLHRGAELLLHAVAEDLELQGPDGGHEDGGVEGVGVAQDLDHALLVQLVKTATELLAAAGLAHPDGGERLGGEGGDGREADRLAVVEGVAHPQAGGVDQCHHITGVGLLHRLPLGAEDRGRVLGGDPLASRLVGQRGAPLEAAAADPDERHPVAVRRVHVGLHLEDLAGEGGLDGPQLALGV